MILSQQPQGFIGSIPPLQAQPIAQYNTTKLFNSLLSPAVTVCIEVSFTSDVDMAYPSTDPFDIDPPQSEPSSDQLPSRRVSVNHADSLGLRTFFADANVQAEQKYGSGRWKDGDLDTPRTPQDNHPGLDVTTRQIETPEDGGDVFEVHRHPDSTSPSSLHLGKAGLANRLNSLGLSRTNETLPNTQSSLQRPPWHSTETKAASIINIKNLHSLENSPQHDPRTLFGVRETHLPWVTRLSSTRFAMIMSPDKVSRDAPPPKSIWDADDDEFDRWPTAVQAREELDTIRHNATTKRSTFIKLAAPLLSVADQIEEAVTTPMGDATRTSVEQQQSILELEDMDCGNPWGKDLHDTIITPLRSHEYPVLPPHSPARHMHVLDANAYTSSIDPVVKAARPRLCDAVATVLAYTSPECLAAFLDPQVEVFEWRRLINCVMIRRQGREVVVGTYYNLGTMYRWGSLVRSSIDADGAWTEMWASVAQGTTPVGKEGVLFEHFEADGTDWDVEPDDEKFALYLGRQLADFLLGYEVWNYYKWWRYRVQWETDGRLTDAREKNRYPAGLTFD